MEGRSRSLGTGSSGPGPPGLSALRLSMNRGGGLPGGTPPPWLWRYGDYSSGAGGAGLSGGGSVAGTVRLRNGWMLNSVSFSFRLP